MDVSVADTRARLRWPSGELTLQVCVERAGWKNGVLQLHLKRSPAVAKQ
jgi:hypothetical protein